MNEGRADEGDVFRDRVDAGRRLADALGGYAGRSDVVVLALPRGGVPVAREVADALGAPLDVLLVRKLGYPPQPELALGAVASGGVRVLNEDLLRLVRVRSEEIDEVTARELEELDRRERAYRGDRSPVPVEGRTVIVVDDGMATGSTLRAAVQTLRERAPSRIVAAVPVAPPETAAALEEVVDELVCLLTPAVFFGISQWYERFPQLSDDAVREALEGAECPGGG
jgi:putative phosphoribosyl transferase